MRKVRYQNLRCLNHVLQVQEQERSVYPDWSPCQWLKRQQVQELRQVGPEGVLESIFELLCELPLVLATPQLSHLS